MISKDAQKFGERVAAALAAKPLFQEEVALLVARMYQDKRLADSTDSWCDES